MTNEVDLRGFAYSLEPLLKRQQWNVDALQLKLARLEKAIGELTSNRGRIQAAYDEHARTMRTDSGVALEPAAYGRSLAHLAAQQGEIAGLNEQLDGLRQELRHLQGECLRSQVKVDITLAHKAECLKEYMDSQQNRLNSERDRDWLARAAFAKEEEASC
jgi:uncharacterized coiled-coil protein SlyX